MNVYSLMFFVIGLPVIVAFSVLAARAEQALWTKCRRRDSCPKMQQQITLGKSHHRRGASSYASQVTEAYRPGKVQGERKGHLRQPSRWLFAFKSTTFVQRVLCDFSVLGQVSL